MVSSGSGQGGILCSLKAGDQLVSHRFKANLYNNGLSDDGKFAVCQLANNDNKDGGTLAFFDIEKGKLLWQKMPESGWADSYDFDIEKKELCLIYNDIGSFRYSFSGKLLEPERWESERIKHASAFELSLIASERLKSCKDNFKKEAGDEILDLLQRALDKGLDDYPNEKASVYRTIGEVYESFGNITETINNYEAAIALNPKVGVKRKLEALRKSQT